jgi:hypothetical protein
MEVLDALVAFVAEHGVASWMAGGTMRACLASVLLRGSDRSPG